MVTAKELRELLHYNRDTGVFTWRVSRGSARAGDVAGNTETECRCGKSRTRLKIRVRGRTYLAHRLAWLYEKGEWPEDQIDHINGDQLDNRMSNLRPATASENQFNVGIRSHNKSGYLGVSWCKKSGKWQSSIKVRNTNIYLGYFDCPVEAHEAYRAAAKELHGEYANYG